MEFVVEQLRLFSGSGTTMSWKESIPKILKFLFHCFWPIVLEWLILAVPMVAAYSLPSRFPWLLHLVAICWMILFPSIFIPLRGGGLINCFSCIAQTVWIVAATTQPLLRITHVVNQVFISFLSTDTEDIQWLSKEHLPSWTSFGFGIIALLVPPHFLSPWLPILSALVALYHLYEWCPRDTNDVKDLKQYLHLPFTIFWFLAMIVLLWIRMYWTSVSLIPSLIWLNALGLLYNTNKQVFGYSETFKELQSLLPEILPKLGESIFRLRQMAQAFFGILKYVFILVYSISGLTTLGWFRFLFHDSWGVHLTIVLLNTLQNILILLKFLFDSLFVNDQQMDTLKKKTVLTDEEKLVMMTYSDPKKRNFKSAELREINRLTKRINKKKSRKDI